jgi:hypothetical protein
VSGDHFSPCIPVQAINAIEPGLSDCDNGYNIRFFQGPLDTVCT